MALRPADGNPDIADDADANCYLGRLVGFLTDWCEDEHGTDEERLFDINNVARFTEFVGEPTSLHEKLRGGSFYITFRM